MTSVEKAGDDVVHAHAHRRQITRFFRKEAYFDNRLSNDLMPFVDLAFDMDFDLLELSDERRAFVREKSAQLFNAPEMQAFIREYLEYIDGLTHNR